MGLVQAEHVEGAMTDVYDFGCFRKYWLGHRQETS